VTARKRVEAAEQQRSELDRVIALAREEERLIDRLLAIRNGDIGVHEPDSAASSNATSIKVSALNAAIEELDKSGRPLHISELLRLLREKGVPLPGAGLQANLITHLSRDQRIVRPSRGMYALATWGLEGTASPRSRQKRKHVRVTATRAQ